MIIDQLVEKLGIKKPKHFALCMELMKSIKNNRMQTLQPEELISNIAALPSSHNMKVLLRLAFLPPNMDFVQLKNDDKVSFDYLYSQCVGDLKRDAVFVQLHYEAALRLVCLQMQQLHLGLQSTSSTNNNQPKSAKETKANFLKSSTNFLSNVVRSIPNTSSNSAINNKSLPTTNCESTNCKGFGSNSRSFVTSADQAIKNSKKCIKLMVDSYGMETFVPKNMVSKFKKPDIQHHLNKCFNRNQSQLIPFVAKQFFNSYSGDQQQQANQNGNKPNDIIAGNLITAATSGQPLLSLVSQINKKSFDLSKVFIDEDLIKLCLIVLMTDFHWFGVHSFPLRNSLNEFRVDEVLNQFDKLLIERADNDEVTNGKNGHLLKRVSKVSAQVWLNPMIGICQIVRSPTKQTKPFALAKLDEIVGIKVTRHEACYLNVELKLKIKLCEGKLVINHLKIDC